MKDATIRAEAFVPLGKRTVKSAYQRTDGTGICVIVDGFEVGGYWFLSEKESGKRDEEDCNDRPIFLAEPDFNKYGPRKGR